MSGPRITDAKKEHVPAIGRIERESFSMPWSEELIESYRSSDNCIFLVAEDGEGAVQGYISCQTVLDEAYIANIATAAEYRRRGIADALVTALLERVGEVNFSFLTLEVRESNSPAISLYQKHGFKTLGKRPNYYEKPKEAALIMTRWL